MSSGTTTVVIVVILAVIALLGAATISARRRRLQQQFGPEYDRAVSEQNSKIRAESELVERQRRVRKLDIRPLPEDARLRYTDRWIAIQEEFVDAPAMAVQDAYALVTTVMRERGYPVDDDRQVMADLSVEHAQTVGHLRAAQDVSTSAAEGGAGTEDLRQAFIHYRALFSDLLGEPAGVVGQTTATKTVASVNKPSANGQPVNGQLAADAGRDDYLADTPAQDQTDFHSGNTEVST